MKATAIVFSAQETVQLQSYELPELAEDEILVRTQYSGVSSGTEIWAYEGLRKELSFPTVPGYQSVGNVVATGANVKGRRVGEQVHFITSRLPDVFPPTWMGAHVSHAIVKSGVTPVPPGTDLVAAAVAALPGVSLRGLKMVDVNIGDLVVVFGQGLIGQGSAQLARLRGATVVATDVAPLRLDLSRKFSADIVVDASKENVGDIVRSIKPAGADCVIETTGRSDMFAPAIDLLRWEGHLLLQGWYPNPITFDFNQTHGKKPRIAVTCGQDDADIPLDLMARNKLHFRRLVTHVVSPEKAPEIYSRLAKRDPDILGVVFDWRQMP
jgi:2-desacetyl-2-hydroxyethyl bacteriochlorophyllide A dehydrogenase